VVVRQREPVSAPPHYPHSRRERTPRLPTFRETFQNLLEEPDKYFRVVDGFLAELDREVTPSPTPDTRRTASTT